MKGWQSVTKMEEPMRAEDELPVVLQETEGRWVPPEVGSRCHMYQCHEVSYPVQTGKMEY